ncbi:hypothetical protein HJG60_010745 [Phyllostomus discolor]|uniref:Uncharacterized protein n=1 Tax=Phyllostomus discolor TaxID=89673 RepID=A0A834ABT4_9CHIR|nr:hypothetical protein HJG60_010745 [Phyllostomus discolor]
MVSRKIEELAVEEKLGTVHMGKEAPRKGDALGGAGVSRGDGGPDTAGRGEGEVGRPGACETAGPGTSPPSLHDHLPREKTVTSFQSSPNPTQRGLALNRLSREPRHPPAQPGDAGTDGPHTSAVKRRQNTGLRTVQPVTPPLQRSRNKLKFTLDAESGTRTSTWEETALPPDLGVQSGSGPPGRGTDRSGTQGGKEPSRLRAAQITRLPRRGIRRRARQDTLKTRENHAMERKEE